MMHNILMVWCKNHYEYKQGMNEILGLLILAMYPYYHKIDRTTTYSETERIYLHLFDENEMEADIYEMFRLIMNKGLKELYYTPRNTIIKNNTPLYKKIELFHSKFEKLKFFDYSETNEQLLIQMKCEKIYDKISIIDKDLYDHFESLGMDHHIVFS